ncbi:hypothetical protein C8R45DRAFT_1135937 [Mycena sanguinolenta]|nr:hypothetical protein C8R45DRAFT_1135937 [Mycena sanguinolenta]
MTSFRAQVYTTRISPEVIGRKNRRLKLSMLTSQQVTLFHLCAGIWTGVDIIRAKEFSQFRLMAPLEAWLAATAVSDLIIVAGMVFYLLKEAARVQNQNKGHSVSDHQVLCLFLAFDGNNYHLGVCIWLSKVYSNSILTILNSRAHIGHEATLPGGTTKMIDMTEVVFNSLWSAGTPRLNFDLMSGPLSSVMTNAEECATDTLYGDDAIDDDGGTFDTEGFLHPGSPSSSLSAQTARTRSWESLPHKSIKCSILERLRDDRQQDSLARRNESDLLGADPKAQVSLAHASSIISAALLRALTTSTGPGFHIIPELPGETPRGHAIRSASTGGSPLRSRPENGIGAQSTILLYHIWLQINVNHSVRLFILSPNLSLNLLVHQV